MSDFQGAFQQWFEFKVDRMNRRAIRAVEDAAEKGDEITRHFIETRGTAKSGKRGRIDTGQMLDSVDHETLKRTSDEVIVSFGYKDTPYWTKYQENGTTAIPAMYALQDATDEVLTDLKEDLEKVIKNA